MPWERKREWPNKIAVLQRITRRQFLAGAAAVAVAPFLLRGLSSSHTDLPPEVTDAVTRRAYDALKGWIDWLEANRVKGYFGETGWPNDQVEPRPDIDQWQALGEKVYRWLDANEIWATAHAASITYEDNHLKMYGPINPEASPLSERIMGVAYAQSAVPEAHPTTDSYNRGMNVTGGAFFGMPYYRFSNDNPGEYGVAYTYPRLESLQYLKERGHYLIRVGFRWERLQPRLGQALDTAELDRLGRVVRDAKSLGLGVILDVANYAGYHFSDGYFRIGTSRLPLWTFANLWNRLSAAFKDQPSVAAYDIMNEPQDMPGGVPQWEEASRRAVAAIRQNGDRKLVMIPGYHKDRYNSEGVFAFTRNHPEAWVADTNIMYTTHGYWGRHSYRYTYGEDNAYWSSRGY